ncbi:MAG: FixH family protein [Magnetospirillum sp.]|nr:FixH family protein [Magnetospirillum sp.]
MAKQRARGWWYPWIFVGVFGVVLAVNGALAYFATTTFTGLETEQAYDKGLAYNRNLAAAKAQQEMGWAVEAAFAPLSPTRVDITVTYRDRTGQPVDGLDVKAQMLRPTTAGYDHQVVLPAKGAGTYGAVIDLPLTGVWDMDAVASGTAGTYQLTQRFVAK